MTSGIGAPPVRRRPPRSPKRGRSSMMGSRTLLFVSTYLPHDFTRDIHGSYQRMRMFVEAIAASGYRIHFLFLVSPQLAAATSSDVAARSIEQFWKIRATVDICAIRTPSAKEARSFWRYYIAPALTLTKDVEYGLTTGEAQIGALRASLRRQPQAIFVMGLEAMLPLTVIRAQMPPVYFDMNDIEHRKALRTLATVRARKGTWLRYLRVHSIVRAERAAASLAAKTFVCSDGDMKYLTKKLGAGQITTIPNAVQIPPLDAEDASGHTVLFVGLLSYPPNNAAVQLLITTIWPLIVTRIPDARLLIVGAGVETVAGGQTCPSSIEFTGFVPDIRPYYDQARVVCCPITVGGGTRIKLIEGAAHGKAMVSTTIGAEGLDLQDGVHALIRDTPKAIAEACIELLQDPQRAASLGSAAHALASAHYSRAAVVDRIRAELER